MFVMYLSRIHEIIMKQPIMSIRGRNSCEKWL